MLLAEVEIRHSRPVAPTRRVALGLTVLPTDPVPGWGPVLLGGLIAVNMPDLAEDLVPDLYTLLGQMESGEQISQPRLRHRFQKDTVGLDSTTHSLIGEGENVWFDFEAGAIPEVNVLGALYAANLLPEESRRLTFRVLRKAADWDRPLDGDFVAHLLGDDAAFSQWRRLPSDTRWALQLLGFGPNDAPQRQIIQTRFRDAVWSCHPDRGGSTVDAGQRMAELKRARDILLRA